MDPLKAPLEELLYVRLGTFFDQLQSRRVPDLYRVVLEQVDRAILRQALERAGGQLGEAARFLGIDRNTLARKARRLKVASNDGPEPQPPRGGRRGSASLRNGAALPASARVAAPRTARR
jgi:DNA-binding protein Fis